MNTGAGCPPAPESPAIKTGLEKYTATLTWTQDGTFQQMLERMKMAMLEYDFQTKEYRYSRNVCHLFPCEFTGGDFCIFLKDNRLIYPEDEAEFWRTFQRAYQGIDIEEPLDVRILTRINYYCWYQFVFIISRDHDGNMRRVLITARNIDEEINLRNSLRFRAEYDETTGIYNRNVFLEKTEALLRQCRDRQKYCILRLDIERFKTVNELFGIVTGDRILRFVGQLLRNITFDNETYGRMNSDVFCACVRRTDEQIRQLITDLNDQLNTYPVAFNFVLSAGIYRVEEEDLQPVSVMCDRATLAQHTIKGNYITRLAFYNASLGKELVQQHEIINSIHKALAEGQFVVYLQPQYRMDTNRMFGAEALVRWIHPQKGLISPAKFIPLFEKNGFILKLDEYVWESACKILRNWLDRGLQPVPISINVSRRHLYDPEFCDKIVYLTRKYALDPKLLELEITESAYVENPKSLFEVIEQLQKQGFVFMMDDFGSGYSSLNMLKEIPVDVLKIDLNFLQEKEGQRDSGRVILEAVIHMAQRLHMPMIAEGVETREQKIFLLEAGCTRAQGYYYSRPVPLEEFEEKFLLPSQGYSENFGA